MLYSETGHRTYAKATRIEDQFPKNIYCVGGVEIYQLGRLRVFFKTVTPYSVHDA